MNAKLAPTGSCIHVLEGDPVALLQQLHLSAPIKQLLSYEETGLEVTYARDRAISAFTKSAGIVWREWQTNGIERGRKDRQGWNKQWHKMMAAPLAQADLSRLSTMQSTKVYSHDLTSLRNRAWLTQGWHNDSHCQLVVKHSSTY